jgi:hypothetical protein
MNPLELDYDDVGSTVVTGSPDGALHDLRAVIIGADTLSAERVRRILGPRGALLVALPDLGQASLAEVRGADPQLVLLPPGTDLEHRAEAARRLGWDARLRFADIERVPDDLDAPAGIDELLEIAARAVSPDREAQAKCLLADAFGLKLSLDDIGLARLVRALAEGRGSHRITLSDSALEARVELGEGAVGAAAFYERNTREEGLDGLAALTAFASLRGGTVHVFPIALACNDLGEVGAALLACASPDYAWVATHVATGRYVQSGAENALENVREGNLPDATRAARPSAISERASEPPVQASGLEMPRPPRPSGPPAPLDAVPRATDVHVQTIVRLEPPEPEIDIDVDFDEYEDPSSPSNASAPIPLTRAIPQVSAGSMFVDADPPRPPLGAPSVDAFAVGALDTVRPPVPRRKSRSLFTWALAASILLSAGGIAGLVVWTGPETVASWVEIRAEEIRDEVERIRDEQLPAASPAEPGAPTAVEAP